MATNQAMEFLNKQTKSLNLANEQIVKDIQTLSNVPITDFKVLEIAKNIDNYGTPLSSGNDALKLMNSNRSYFSSSDISTFSSLLTTLKINFESLRSCYTNGLSGYTCSGSSGSSGTTSSTSSTSARGSSGSSGTSTTTSSAQTTQENSNSAVTASDYEASLLTFTGGNREFFQDYSSFGTIYGKNMPAIEGLTFMDNYNIELQLITQLNEFNKKYDRYIKCNDPFNNAGCAQEEICINKNPTITVDNCKPLSDVYKMAGEINTTFSTLRGTNNNPYNLGSAPIYLTPNQYETRYQQIIQNHDSVIKLRNELDNKVKILYNPAKSIDADYKKSLDATVYSGILITALATSILYYSFNHL